MSTSSRRAARWVALTTILACTITSAQALGQGRGRGRDREGTETLTLGAADLADWYVVRGNAGGRQEASGMASTTPSGPCAGYITRRPDFSVTLTERIEQLVVRARSRRDVTLVIEGPDGVRCNDDAMGLNPAIVGDFAAGTYEIWVGTFEPEQNPRFTLAMMALPPLRGADEPDDEPAEVVVIEVPVVPAGPALIARGEIEGVPFVFTGYGAEGVIAQCDAYWLSASPNRVDDVTVNGTRRQNRGGFWNQAETCMMIAALATPDGLPATQPICTVGDRIQVLWGASWYDATVEQGPNAQNECQIGYDGYGDSWDEWVGPARMRPRGGN
jgi:hypothetical protein